MTPVRAALMTLVQCRPLWFWHLIGGMLCLIALIRPLTPAGAGEGAVFGVLVVPLWIGVVTASLYKDILSKPFSFGLPRHQSVWRGILFATALGVAAVCTLVTSFGPADTTAAVAVRAWTTFLLCAAMFMTGVLATASLSNASFLPALITLVFFVSLDENFAVYVRVSVERALLASPAATTVVGAAVTAAAWRTLGSRAWSRKSCGEAFLPLHGMWSGERQAAYTAQRKMRWMHYSPGAFMVSLERFVLARMRSLAGHPTLRSLWGTLYIQVGRAAPARPSNLVALALFLAAATVVLGFPSPHRMDASVSEANLILLLVCALTADYRVNPHAALLLNVSRKNRFRSLLFSAAAQWLVVAVVAAVLTAVSIAAGHYLDIVTIRGNAYTYKAMHPVAFLIFAPMLPFFFLTQVLIPRHRIVAMIVIVIIGTIAYISNGHRLLAMPFPALVLLQAVSWLPFVAIVRSYCYSGDLKLNGQ